MEVKLPVKIEKKVVEMGKKELSKFDLIANEIVGLVLQNGRFRILDTVYRAEFYDANSSWFPFLTNILLSIRPWFYLHMATDARRKAIVYVTVVASCPMCPTYIYIYMFNRVPLDHDVNTSLEHGACSIFLVSQNWQKFNHQVSNKFIDFKR